MYKILSLMIFLVLMGCDNTITNNSGAIPNIDFKGSIWAGNVRYARVQFVGVDQYGQAQRQTDGSYYGDSYYSDDLGQFSASIQGAYAGSLVAVASSTTYDEIITPATDSQAAVIEARVTQIRCVLPAGCNNEVGAPVLYGDWYEASTDFEMLSAISSIAGLEQLNITPVTHLAAKQAFNQSVSLGVNCDAADVNTCVGTEIENNIFTPETIFEGNHRVKQFFLLSSGLHVNTPPWYDGIVLDDSISEIESAKHGLISMALQKFSTDRSEPVMTTLNGWVESFLKHDGNFYEDAETDYPAEMDLLNLFSTAVAVAVDYESNVINDSVNAISSAKSLFSESILTLTNKTLLPFTAVSFNEGTADKIIAAQALVSKLQVWALDLESNQYESFFDADIAQEITDIENEWAEYNQKISPVMKSFFKPLIKTAEYALTCIRVGGCDAGHDMFLIDGSLLVFNSANKSISLIDDTPGMLTLDGQVYSYTAIHLAGSFDDVLGQSDTYKIFSFTKAHLETTEGEVDLISKDGVLPSVAFWLGEALAQNIPPVVVRIDIAVPNLILKSQTATQYQFSTTVFDATLVGTQDPVQLVTTASPYHYNILSANIEGSFSGVLAGGDSMDLRFSLNSENAETYYSPTRFPDLEINIDSTAFKSFTKLEGEASGFISNQGGWFTLPANVTSDNVGQGGAAPVTPLVLSGDEAVTFFDKGTYAVWGDEYGLLKELLDLKNSTSAKLGTLKYPGGETALVIFKAESSSSSELARQCTRVGEAWGCQAALSVSTLGCGEQFSNSTATIIEAFTWLKSEECISRVKIDGRGTFDIDYVSLTDDFVSPQSFDITLSSPEYLGVKSFYVSLISRFVDGTNENRPVALFVLNGAAPDIDNVTLGMSLTHDYIGVNSGAGASIGLDSIIPYGDNSLWLAVGQSSVEQDALVYYIQDVNITMTVFGFDYSEINPDFDPAITQPHDKPLAVIRYDGQLLGSLRKEGDLYVIRYIDGTWQLL